jgi:hypothetical protein
MPTFKDGQGREEATDQVASSASTAEPRLADYDGSTAVYDLAAAKRRLGRFVRDIANETEVELDFTWRAAATAPFTFDALQREFHLARVTGLPFRVRDSSLSESVYSSPATELASRFWHDTRHVWLGAPFTLEGEFAVASCQLARLQLAGYEPDSVEYRLLEADTLGQAIYYSRCGRFPASARRFALRCLESDLADAVSAEIAAQSEPVPA